MSPDLPTLPQRGLLLGIILAFFAATVLVYGHSLDNDFVRWDDGMLVYENPAIREISPRTLKHIFTTYDPELYIPLTFLTYQIDYAIAGIQPFLYHLDNLILHTLNALLVAWFAFLLTRKGWVGLVCGLLFALHPLHTEAVEWVSARKDVLSTFFFLLSLIGYLYYRESGRKRTLIWSVLVFVLGLLSKVMVITLPVVLVLIDLRERRPVWSLAWLKEKAPYLVASIVFGLIAIGGKTGVIQSSTLSAKILIAFKSAVFYLGKIFLPTHFSLLYPYTKQITITSPDFFVPILVVCALIVVGIWAWRRLPDLTFGLLFYAVTVAPTFINFARGGDLDVFFASDRYAYVPSIGIFIGITALLWSLRERIGQWALNGIAAAALLGSAGLAYSQSFVWQNTETLFQNVLKYYPESSHVAHNNLGNVYRLRNEYDRAIAEYEQALAIRPHSKTMSNLGAVYRKLGQYDKALEQYRKALELNPESKEAHFGLGIVHASLRRFPEAIDEYHKALAIDPQYEEAYTNLGVVLAELRRMPEAIEAYRKALAINPFLPEAHFNLAVALAATGDIDSAMEEYETVLRQVPTYIPARINLALLLYQIGERDAARSLFEQVLQIDPKNAAARRALQQMGG